MLMDFETFKSSLNDQAPHPNLSPALRALWHDARGDWHTAHELAQAQGDRDGAWVHAYLHRKEGDAANAAYWYRRAGQRASTLTTEAEWEALVRALLEQPG